MINLRTPDQVEDRVRLVINSYMMKGIGRPTFLIMHPVTQEGLFKEVANKFKGTGIYNPLIYMSLDIIRSSDIKEAEIKIG